MTVAAIRESGGVVVAKSTETVTTHVYRVSGESDALTIADHYAAQLDGWAERRPSECESGCEDDEELVVTFSRGAAIITLAFDNLSAGSYERSVDHDGGGSG